MTDYRRRFQPHAAECHRSSNCYCVHVTGSRDRKKNPKPARCEGGASGPMMQRNMRISPRCAPWQLGLKCSCWTGDGCLYSSMSTGTTVSAISIARAAGVEHIIEEGREGGMSAFVYQLHGFQLTSLEYLPEEESTAALALAAPSVRWALLAGWDEMGWDGMRWDGAGRGGAGWDEVGAVRQIGRTCVNGPGRAVGPHAMVHADFPSEDGAPVGGVTELITQTATQVGDGQRRHPRAGAGGQHERRAGGRDDGHL